MLSLQLKAELLALSPIISFWLLLALPSSFSLAQGVTVPSTPWETSVIMLDAGAHKYLRGMKYGRVREFLSRLVQICR